MGTFLSVLQRDIIIRAQHKLPGARPAEAAGGSGRRKRERRARRRAAPPAERTEAAGPLRLDPAGTLQSGGRTTSCSGKATYAHLARCMHAASTPPLSGEWLPRTTLSACGAKR